MIRNKAKKIERRIGEATTILHLLGLPLEQQNERSALTLLALVGLRPDDAWSYAKSDLIGVTPIMDFAKQQYDKPYAPNSRETFRRFTLHQFIQAGIAVQNPDDPNRPTNSPKNVYQVEPSVLSLLKQFGMPTWEQALREYLSTAATLSSVYASERAMRKNPVVLPSGATILLSAGGQNLLVKEIIEEFCPRFTPSALPIYVGDTAEKWAYFDESLLTNLGVSIEEHGKIPDVVIYFKKKHWLVLIEAVTSHGPISPKRLYELKVLFDSSTAGVVFVTAFPDAKTFSKYSRDIAWETEVWIADAPSHLIHFNGERFLGPYGDEKEHSPL